MLNSIYFEAAQLLPAADGTNHPMTIGSDDTAYGCCDAIEAACNRSKSTVWEERGEYKAHFCRIFQPGYSRFSYWFDCDEQDEKDPDKENCAKARVLALLFMHWMTVDP